MTDLELTTQTPAPTARGRRRRRSIIDAAAELFAQRGFHATGIDDIGAAAGITGPGIYRHFAAKEDLLIAVLDRMWERLRDALERAEGQPAEEAFTTLAEAHAALALEDPASVGVLLRELRHAPDWYQRAAQRNEDRYLEAWSRVVVGLRPDLDPPTARAVARALTTLLWSPAAERPARRLARDRTLALLLALARGCVEAAPAS